jgi:CSLREA domain-containing protein
MLTSLFALAMTLSTPSELLVPITNHRVNTYADEVDGDGCTPAHCSLREAITAAHEGFGSDSVLLSAGTYTITRNGPDDTNFTGDFDIDAGMSIVGVGAGVTIVDGGGLDRVFHLPPSSSNRSVRFRSLTVTGGFGSGTSVAIDAAGSSTTLTIEDCEITGNTQQGEVRGVVGARLGSTLFMRRTTIANNVSLGVSVQLGNATLENVTLTENTSIEIVASQGANVVCRHCTVADPDDPNSAIVFAFDSGSSIDFENSIVVGPCDEGLLFNIGSLGGNLEGPGDTCHFNTPTDTNNIADMGLAQVADNGGPTRTMLPLPTSPAVDGAVDAACLATDQPGAARPAVGCDVGALEAETAVQLKPLFLDGFEQGHAGAWTSVVGE